MTLTTGASARRALVHPAAQWESLHEFHGVTRLECPRAVLTTPHTGRWQRAHRLDCLRPLPGPLPGHGQCPGQPAPGQPLPVPPAARAADSWEPRPLREGAYPVWTPPGPRPEVPLLSCLSTPPRNTASLHGPMLVRLRNKTQKQIKRQFRFKQERGQVSGTPGRRPSVPTPGAHFPPTGSGGIKAEASMWFAPAVSLHLISFVFPPRMFALTQVPFIETSVIKCKTLPGTTGRAARNCHT